MELDKISRFGFGFHRFLGVVFITFSVGFLYFSVPMLLEPEATVRFNGKETNEFTAKLFVVAFSSIFLVIGLFFALVSKTSYEKLFIKNNKLLKLISKFQNRA